MNDRRAVDKMTLQNRALTTDITKNYALITNLIIEAIKM